MFLCNSQLFVYQYTLYMYKLVDIHVDTFITVVHTFFNRFCFLSDIGFSIMGCHFEKIKNKWQLACFLHSWYTIVNYILMSEMQ